MHSYKGYWRREKTLFGNNGEEYFWPIARGSCGHAMAHPTEKLPDNTIRTQTDTEVSSTNGGRQTQGDGQET